VGGIEDFVMRLLEKGKKIFGRNEQKIERMQLLDRHVAHHGCHENSPKTSQSFEIKGLKIE